MDTGIVSPHATSKESPEGQQVTWKEGAAAAQEIADVRKMLEDADNVRRQWIEALEDKWDVEASLAELVDTKIGDNARIVRSRATQLHKLTKKRDELAKRARLLEAQLETKDPVSYVDGSSAASAGLNKGDWGAWDSFRNRPQRTEEETQRLIAAILAERVQEEIKEDVTEAAQAAHSAAYAAHSADAARQELERLERLEAAHNTWIAAVKAEQEAEEALTVISAGIKAAEDQYARSKSAVDRNDLNNLRAKMPGNREKLEQARSAREASEGAYRSTDESAYEQSAAALREGHFADAPTASPVFSRDELQHAAWVRALSQLDEAGKRVDEAQQAAAQAKDDVEAERLTDEANAATARYNQLADAMERKADALGMLEHEVKLSARLVENGNNNPQALQDYANIYAVTIANRAAEDAATGARGEALVRVQRALQVRQQIQPFAQALEQKAEAEKNKKQNDLARKKAQAKDKEAAEALEKFAKDLDGALTRANEAKRTVSRYTSEFISRLEPTKKAKARQQRAEAEQALTQARAERVAAEERFRNAYPDLAEDAIAAIRVETGALDKKFAKRVVNGRYSKAERDADVRAQLESNRANGIYKRALDGLSEVDSSAAKAAQAAFKAGGASWDAFKAAADAFSDYNKAVAVGVVDLLAPAREIPMADLPVSAPVEESSVVGTDIAAAVVEPVAETKPVTGSEQPVIEAGSASAPAVGTAESGVALPGEAVAVAVGSSDDAEADQEKQRQLVAHLVQAFSVGINYDAIYGRLPKSTYNQVMALLKDGKVTEVFDYLQSSIEDHQEADTRQRIKAAHGILELTRDRFLNQKGSPAESAVAAPLEAKPAASEPASEADAGETPSASAGEPDSHVAGTTEGSSVVPPGAAVIAVVPPAEVVARLKEGALQSETNTPKANATPVAPAAEAETPAIVESAKPAASEPASEAGAGDASGVVVKESPQDVGKNVLEVPAFVTGLSGEPIRVQAGGGDVGPSATDAVAGNGGPAQPAEDEVVVEDAASLPQADPALTQRRMEALRNALNILQSAQHLDDRAFKEYRDALADLGPEKFLKFAEEKADRARTGDVFNEVNTVLFGVDVYAALKKAYDGAEAPATQYAPQRRQSVLGDPKPADTKRPLWKRIFRIGAITATGGAALVAVSIGITTLFKTGADSITARDVGGGVAIVAESTVDPGSPARTERAVPAAPAASVAEAAPAAAVAEVPQTSPDAPAAEAPVVPPAAVTATSAAPESAPPAETQVAATAAVEPPAQPTSAPASVNMADDAVSGSQDSSAYAIASLDDVISQNSQLAGLLGAGHYSSRYVLAAGKELAFALREVDPKAGATLTRQLAEAIRNNPDLLRNSDTAPWARAIQADNNFFESTVGLAYLGLLGSAAASGRRAVVNVEGPRRSATRQEATYLDRVRRHLTALALRMH